MEGEALQDLFSLKFSHQLMKFRDAALELGRNEAIVFDLFQKYIHTIFQNPEMMNLILLGRNQAHIPGIPDDLIPLITGFDSDIMQIHMHSKALAIGTERTFTSAINLYAKQHNDVQEDYQDQVKNFVESHIHGKFLSEQNHEFFIRLFNAAHFQEEFTQNIGEYIWQYLVAKDDVQRFAYEIDRGIHDYVIGHGGNLPPEEIFA